MTIHERQYHGQTIEALAGADWDDEVLEPRDARSVALTAFEEMDVDALLSIHEAIDAHAALDAMNASWEYVDTTTD